MSRYPSSEPTGCPTVVEGIDPERGERRIHRALESRGLARLKTMQARFAAICGVRAAGAYFGVELGHLENDSQGNLGERLLYRSLADGLSFKIGAGNIVTLCPPLTIADADFDQALSILDGSLSKTCETQARRA